ncbi:uncharacterized protein LOC122967786 [Thunnus albacares]|uniref:uncharacterized protein LOC122967786 n=1 Tax=Thunnus albacares TaxID=8236 RepID=UPI001CF706A3|nr:uncharacterized protein LOC122967786 [Thunnus albacares]
MATADQLLELIFSWIEQRERCAEKLRTLARELESLREKCNSSECIGSSVSVVGTACLIGAGVATLFTGGAAAPALGLLGGVYTGVGLTVSLATKLTEHLKSSNTMKDAQKIEQKSNDIGETIQRLLKKLKAEKKGVNSFADPDELDRHVMTEILGAMARRNGLKWPINISSFGDGWGGARGFTGQDSPQLNPNLIMPEVMTAVASVLICFSFQAEGKASKLLFAKGAEQLIKTVSSAGFKTFLKGGGMAVGGAVGLAFALSEAIDNWKDLIEKNHVTEASQSLRDTADAIDIKKAFQRFQRKSLIEFAIENCEDEAVRRWLRVNSESDVFSQLVDMFNFLKKHIDEEEKKDHSNNVHITFVAHGCIGDSMIPASRLLPLPSITDVILYSPWNCSITASVAYGIATGRMKPQHRVFYCDERESCQIPDEKHRPSKLPDHWNSMKKAGDQKIPNITVSPQEPPEDGTWKKFESLKKKYGPPGRNHIVIPFNLPPESSSLKRVPFFIVTLALSLVLLSSRFKATVHLIACLSDRSAEKKFDQEYLKQQYACTINNTGMKCSPDMFKESLKSG